MRIIWGRIRLDWRVTGDRDDRSKVDIAHCVARYAREDDPCEVDGFVLEQEVEGPFGRGTLLRIDEDGYLGLLMDKDQAGLLYFRHTLCRPV